MKFYVYAFPKTKYTRNFISEVRISVEAKNKKEAVEIAKSVVLDFHTTDFTWKPQIRWF